MTYLLKGFLPHANFANNTPGEIAVIGELSTYAKTYTREPGLYTNASPATTGVALVSFLSVLDGQAVVVPNAIATSVLTIGKWIYDQAIAAGGEIFADELLNELLTQFQTSGEEFECGAIVTDGRYWMPEWVSWKTKAADEERIKVWFVDESFRLQYDNFDIVVIPPIDVLDDFFKTGAQVEALLKARDAAQAMQKIQDAKNGHPETVIRTLIYDYVDPLNAAHRVPSNWSVLIYGEAGNNVDSINDALIEHILANSSRPREDWVKILPDLFKRTEFILVPQWNVYAVDQLETRRGIYSPNANLQKAVALIKRVAVNYSGSHIDANASLFGFPYKSLIVGCVGGIENREDLFQLVDVFPDYINTSTSSDDFGHQSLETQRWVLLIDRLVQAAEVASEFSAIPREFTRVKRGDILYLVADYQNIHYLVACKATLPTV